MKDQTLTSTKSFLDIHPSIRIRHNLLRSAIKGLSSNTSNNGTMIHSRRGILATFPTMLPNIKNRLVHSLLWTRS
jgi:hypothetical protein